MWMLALSDYVKHGKRNLFIAVQMALLFFVLIVMSATLYDEFRLYQPIQSFENRQGILYRNTSAHSEQPGRLLEGVKDIDHVLTYGVTGFYQKKNTVYYPSAIYDETLLRTFRPNLSEGNWFEENADVLQVVISQNAQGWKTGDVISLEYTDANQKERTLQAKVIGILQEGASVFGRELGQSDDFHQDYRDLYTTYRFEQEQNTLLLFSREQIESWEVPVDYNSTYLISYREGTSNSLVSENKRQILANGEKLSVSQGDISFVSLEDFIASTKKELGRNVMMVLPVMLCILLVTLISLITVCTLNMRESYRQNAVFYLLGLDWKKSGIFAVIQSGFTLLLALVFSLLFLNFVYLLNLEDFFHVAIHMETILVVALCALFLFLISLVIPAVMVRKKQPVDVLRQERM